MIVLPLLNIIPGCVQHNCCGYQVNNYICIKGTDTVYLYSTNYDNNPYNGNLKAYADTINFYYSNGYTVNPNYNSPLWQTNCVVGQKALNNALSKGESCFEAVGACSNGESCE